MALENAGFEVRDRITHLFGSGFPKSLDVGKAIDKKDGRLGFQSPNAGKYGGDGGGLGARPGNSHRTEAFDVHLESDLAKQWDGWGTALKPGAEDWWLARKPLAGTVAQTVAAHGTGAINVDGCRLQGNGWSKQDRESGAGFYSGKFMGAVGVGEPTQKNGLRESVAGRWPANVVLSHTPECREVGTRKVKPQNHGHRPRSGNTTSMFGPNNHAGGESNNGYGDADGTETVTAWDCSADCPVRLLDEQSGKLTSGGTPPRRFSDKTRNTYGSFTGEENPNGIGSSQGGASRFFYCAKSSRAEREMGLDGRDRKAKLWSSGTQNPGSFQAEGTDRTSTNHHPTVKPLALMRWLCRLITPPNGLILDPFMGSGSTGMAAVLENFRFVGIEQDAEYVEIARRRIAKCQEQPDLWSVA
jgi:site-specific DNA-methyltransferase (adenine-specific)